MNFQEYMITSTQKAADEAFRYAVQVPGRQDRMESDRGQPVLFWIRLAVAGPMPGLGARDHHRFEVEGSHAGRLGGCPSREMAKLTTVAGSARPSATRTWPSCSSSIRLFPTKISRRRPFSRLTAVATLL